MPRPPSLAKADHELVITRLINAFEDEAGQTLYTARAHHWNAEDCEAHEKMGFYEDWGVATDQLARLAATL